MAIDPHNTIAIVGMSCRLPGAEGVERFWEDVCAGRDVATYLTDEDLRTAGVSQEHANEPAYVRRRFLLDDVTGFDARLFGFAQRDAELTDPQHRIFLECAFAALVDAGIDPRSPGEAVGVFGGASASSYFPEVLAGRVGAVTSAAGFLASIANDKDYLCTGISHRLDLDGPSIGVQTACSTSLVAVHLACQSLQARECDTALAGGVTVRVPHRTGYRYEPGGLFSPTGQCRPFDAGADGVAFGNGCGVVVLKRLADALRDTDRIDAVILGSAVGNDGRDKVGYAASSVNGQKRVMLEALAVSGVEPRTIRYVEAHGSGTRLGDAMEYTALRQVLDTGGARPDSCWVGAVKANVGHLECAAGVVGLIKAALVLRNRRVPPLDYFREITAEVDAAGSPLRFNRTLETLAEEPTGLRACVNSLGMGGTNAHVVLQEPPVSSRRPAAEARPAPFAFQRKRCWFDAAAPQRRHEPREGRRADAGFEWHHLDVAHAALAGIHETHVETERHGFLRDHKIMGRAIVPGMTFIEMVVPNAQHLLSIESPIVRDVQIERPLLVPERGSVAVQLTFEAESNGRAAFSIASRSDREGTWLLHTRGVVARSENGSAPMTELDLDAIRARCPETITGGDFYREFAERGVDWGPAFRGVTRLHRGEGEVLAHVEAPREIAVQLGEYSFHPALADACGQALFAALALPNGDRSSVVSTGLESMRIVARPRGSALWSHARLAAPGALRGDIRIYELDGTPVAELIGVSLQRMAKAARQPSLPSHRYELRWQPRPLPVATSRSRPREGWLVYMDDARAGQAICALLERQGQRCVRVAGADRLDLPALMNRMAQAGTPVRGILASWSSDDDGMTVDDLERSQRRLAAELLALLRAATGCAAMPVLWLLTRGVHTPGAQIRSEATLWGLGRSLANEHRDHWGGLVDVACDTPPQQLAEQVCRELLEPDGEDQIAYFEGERRVARLVHAPASRLHEPLVYRADASYLITGGFGGIGARLARSMVADGARELVLVGRTPPSPQDGSDGPGALLLDLRRQGARIHVLAVDVANEGALRNALRGLGTRLERPIAGIVHAAGVLDRRPLAQSSAEDIARVLRAKVLGALVLHRVFVDSALDFLAFFSSGAALLGSPSLAAYAGANAFLDALALHRRARGQAAITINWGPWASTGMTARLTDAASGPTPGFEDWALIDPDDGIAQFSELLAGEAAQVAVLPVDWQRWAKRYPSLAAAPLLSEVVPGMPNEIESSEASDLRLELLAADPSQRRARLWDRLAAWLLHRLPEGAGELDADASLAALGLDSLAVIELKNYVDDSVGVSLSTERYMAAAGLHAIVDAVLEGFEQRGADALLAEALAQVESMSDDDALRLAERVGDD